MFIRNHPKTCIRYVASSACIPNFDRLLQFILLVSCICTFLFPSRTEAANVSWIVGSGDWANASNWSTGAVPTAADDVTINVPGVVTVTISNGSNAAKSLQCANALTISGGELSLTGSSSISGAFTINQGGLLSVAGGGVEVAFLGNSTIDNGRFEVLSGAVVTIPNATTYDITELDPNIVVANVSGIGSRLNLYNVLNLTIGSWFEEFGQDAHQLFSATNGGVIDFSGTNEILNYASGGDYGDVRFISTSGGEILFPSLTQINSYGYASVSFSFEEGIFLPALTSAEGAYFALGSGLSLPALEDLSYTTMTVESGQVVNLPSLAIFTQSKITIHDGGTINASNLADVSYDIIAITGTGAAFNTSLLTSIDQTSFDIRGGYVFDNIGSTKYDTSDFYPDFIIINVDGPGSRLDLSSVQTVIVGCAGECDSGELNYSATNGGVIDFSGVKNLSNVTAHYNDLAVHFISETGGQILFSRLEVIDWDDYFYGSTPVTYFDFEEPLNLPSLSFARGVDFGGVTGLELPLLTTAQTCNFNLQPGDSLSLPSLTSAEFSTITIPSGAEFHAPNLNDLAYAHVSVSGNAVFERPTLTNIDNVSFDIRDGYVFDNIAATTLFWDGVTINVQGAGSRLDLSSVHEIVVYDYSTQDVQAIDGGVIDLSSVVKIEHADAYYYYFGGLTLRTLSGGLISLPSLQIVSTQYYCSYNNPQTIFEFESQTNLPSLTAVACVNFENTGYLHAENLESVIDSSFTVRQGEVVNLPFVASFAGCSVTIDDGGVLHAPNVSEMPNAFLKLDGSAIFNTAPLTSIDNTRFAISGGNVFSNITATKYDTSNIISYNYDDLIVNVTGVGSALDFSTVRNLLVGTDYQSSHQTFLVSAGGTFNLSNVITFLSYVDRTNSDLTFAAEGTDSLILLSHVGSLRAYNLKFVSTDGGSIDISKLSISDYGPIIYQASGPDSLITLGALCISRRATFSATAGGAVLYTTQPAPTIANSIYGVRSIDLTDTCTGSYCYESRLFSYYPDGSCLNDIAVIRYPNLPWPDVDALASSTAHGLIGFELTHAYDSSITGSQLLSINPSDGSYTRIGNVFPGREVRAATILGQNIIAVDIANQELLTISPASGVLLKTLPISNIPNGELSRAVDITVAPNGALVLLDSANSESEAMGMIVDFFSGEITSTLFADSGTINGGHPAGGYTGATFAEDPRTGTEKLHALKTIGADETRILDPVPDGEREILQDVYLEYPSFDSSFGDLASIVSVDDVPPGPVSIVVQPGSSSSILLDWSSYNEVANGDDIHHYSVYQANAPFTSAGAASVIATVPRGTKTYRVTGLNAGETKYYAVVATDLVGNKNDTVSSVPGTPVADTVPPSNVTHLRAISGETSLLIQWDHHPNTDGDLGGIQVFVDNTLVSGNLAPTATSFNVTNLAPANSYAIVVKAYDIHGNVNAGSSLTAATWLPNPGNIGVTPAISGLDVSWNAVTPASILKQYRVYIDTTAFTSVAGRSAATTVSAASTSAQLRGLTNGTTYFVAVTAVNISDGERSIVTPVTGIPVGDTNGPAITNPTFNGAPLENGAVISASGTIGVDASDISGLGGVEFLIRKAGSDSQLRIDSGSGPHYTAYWNALAADDGPYTIIVRAYDTLTNVSEVTFAVTLALAPPQAPTILSPANSARTNSNSVTVIGTAPAGSTVQVYVGNTAASPVLALDNANQFQASVPVVEGNNSITAKALNRAGTSPASGAVNVVVDSTIPHTPSNLTSQRTADGNILLSWSNNEKTQIVTFEVYRAAEAFEDVGSAVKINSAALSGTTYIDAPVADGTYYYRVRAINNLHTPSALSNQVTGTKDSTAPVASIAYETDGAYDSASATFGQGNINITLTASEKLLAVPFLTLAADGGVPITISLAKIDDTTYRGGFAIDEFTPSGTLNAVFSGRDLFGNRGTVISQGASILVDSKGPEVSSLSVTPNHPIKNDAQAPVAVTTNFTFSSAPASSATPVFAYKLSGAPGAVTAISNCSPNNDRTVWSCAFTLPAAAGEAAPESLQFSFSAEDSLGNIGTKIKAFNMFQVYQGALPPAEVPSGLQAHPRPAGKVSLSWNAVNEAVAYQLYRLAPGEFEFSALGAPLSGTNFEDTTNVDGSYQYAVASIRRFNSQEAISAQSNPVTVTADATQPNAPQNLALQLTAHGILASWEAPQGGIVENGIVTYSLFRADKAPGVPLDLSGLSPIIQDIDDLQAVDSQPSQAEHAYAVAAVDEAGNISGASNTVYLNFGLLPVETLQVTVVDGRPPQVSWFHSSPSISSYRVAINGDVVASAPTPSYTDTGYNGDERNYSVVAIDNNSAESAARAVTLPNITANLATDSSIKRGVFNRLSYEVVNHSHAAIENATLRVTLKGRVHTSTVFAVPADQAANVPVVIGGYDDLAAQETLTTAIDIQPNAGESVEISKSTNIAVTNDALALRIDTDNLVRGATGKVRFSLENTSDVTTEIITARNNGAAASDEVRFKLLDGDENVFTVLALKQVFGDSVITTPDGTTVARVEPHQQFVSSWFDINVPAAMPDSVRLQLEVDKFNFMVGSSQHVAIKGNGSIRDVTLVEPPYVGEITSISPESSFGDKEILIRGQAVDPVTGDPFAHEKLDLVLQVSGYEQVRSVTTIDDGTFLFRFQPKATDAGVYTVSALYPGTIDRPDQGQFTIGRVTLSPNRVDVRAPENYVVDLKPVAKALGKDITNLRLAYLAVDQVGAALPQGITLSLPPAINLPATQSAELPFSFAADQTAHNNGIVRLRLLSDTTGSEPITFFDINYQLSAAAPSVVFDPAFLESGVNHNNTVNETVYIENRGLAPLVNAQISLLSKTTGLPAPYWIYVTSPKTLDRLDVGERRQVDIIASPDNSVSEDYHEFILRVSAPGETPQDLPIVVAVTQDGVGDVIVHVSDIYTATLDESGQPIPGLAGARVKIEHEQISTIHQEATSDSAGELTFHDLPAGRYIIRASAPDHANELAYINVKPGITTPQEIFLVNSVITVEWSVKEITLEDRYDIILDLLYETNVPIPVLVMEPASINLPKMKKGEVLLGELSLTNYGLINAIEVKAQFPASDSTLRYEFAAPVPDVIAPFDRVIIPYRLTAVADFDPAVNGITTSGGSCGYSSGAYVTGAAICINGTRINLSSNTVQWFNTSGCPSPGSTGGIIVFPGGGGSGGGRPSTPPGLGSIACVPGINCDRRNSAPGS